MKIMVDKSTVSVPRSLWERLFSWTPWKKTKEVCAIPDGKILGGVEYNTMNPRTYDFIRRTQPMVSLEIVGIK